MSNAVCPGLSVCQGCLMGRCFYESEECQFTFLQCHFITFISVLLCLWQTGQGWVKVTFPFLHKSRKLKHLQCYFFFITLNELFAKYRGSWLDEWKHNLINKINILSLKKNNPKKLCWMKLPTKRENAVANALWWTGDLSSLCPSLNQWERGSARAPDVTPVRTKRVRRMNGPPLW